MALDWEPLPTPKRGYEAEHESLVRKLERADGSLREQAMKWFLDITEPPFATIGAPRIGFDPEADEWLRSRLEKSGRLAELAAIQADMRGDHILEIMPPCDGFPVYSNHREAEHLDRYSFHAELLHGIVSDDLWQQAHRMLVAPEHRQLAEQLLDAAMRFADDHKLPNHVETIREPVFAEGTPERGGHILFAAAKWCWYWSERGHGLAVIDG
jgi:hypothetical protein